MSELTERLDALRALIQSHGFLTGDGLSNEVNIRIFCYAAEDAGSALYSSADDGSDPELPSD